MDRAPVRFALAAALAGLAWGYVRHRRDRRAVLFSVLQGLEWFVAYGGAAALLARLREGIESEDEPLEIERVTHIRRVTSERTGTDG
jgi:hypothetical protein